MVAIFEICTPKILKTPSFKFFIQTNIHYKIFICFRLRFIHLKPTFLSTDNAARHRVRGGGGGVGGRARATAAGARVRGAGVVSDCAQASYATWWDHFIRLLLLLLQISLFLPTAGYRRRYYRTTSHGLPIFPFIQGSSQVFSLLAPPPGFATADSYFEVFLTTIPMKNQRSFRPIFVTLSPHWDILDQKEIVDYFSGFCRQKPSEKQTDQNLRNYLGHSSKNSRFLGGLTHAWFVKGTGCLLSEMRSVYFFFLVAWALTSENWKSLENENI